MNSILNGISRVYNDLASVDGMFVLGVVLIVSLGAYAIRSDVVHKWEIDEVCRDKGLEHYRGDCVLMLTEKAIELINNK